MTVRISIAEDALDAIHDPEVRAAVASCSVPSDGYLFDPTGVSGSTWVPVRDGAFLVLGTVTEDQEICLDTRDGSVIARSTWDHEAQAMVNRDLGSFARCLEIFEASLPFYQTSNDLEEAESAATNFAAAIRSLGDETIDDPNSFWQMIIHDIESGDYNAADLDLE